MTRMSLALMLSFFMVAHKAAGRFEVYEDMVQFLLVLGILSQKILKLKVCSGAPTCSEACLFFSNDSLRLRLQSVPYDPA